MEMFVPELLASATMMFFMFGVNMFTLHPQHPYPRFLGHGLAIGMGLLMVLPYRAILNPAIVIALAMNQEITWQATIPYLISQIVGVLAGCYLAFVVHRAKYRSATKEEIMEIMQVDQRRDSYVHRFFGEGIASLVLVMLLRAISTLPASDFQYTIWSSLAYLSLYLATGYGMNPAIAIGTRIAYVLFPLQTKGKIQWLMGGVGIAAALLGATIAIQLIHALQLG